ncbi:hypothetical protein ACWDTT_05930 [Streptosporangium sandarakinum]|uniref:hypothetical protein n=1 Tax=Streptosporangium TaxID=2000 RepID=UPI0031F98AEA
MLGGSVVMARGTAGVVAGFISLALLGAWGMTPSSPRQEKKTIGADMSVRLVSSPKPAQPGQILIYRAEVRNNGPEDAVLPLLTVRLPRGVDVLRVDVAECRPGATAREVVCPSQRDVLAGETGGVTVSGLVRPGAGGPLTATATLSSEVVDANEADNVARAVTPVDEGADLAVRLSGERRAGRRVTMGAVVRNRGPRTVRDATVFFDTGAARLLSVRGARCHPSEGHVGCRLGAVASGERVGLRLALRAAGRAPRARATVYSPHVGDRRPANNIARIDLR